MITRRRLLITIALLVVIDLATGLFYVVSRLNADGKYVGLFAPADSTALPADTLAASAVSVKFEPVRNDMVYYVSETTLPTGQSSAGQFTCIKQVKLRMPHSVGGSTAIDGLKQAIIIKAFGPRYGDESRAVAAFIDAPEFNMGGNSSYRVSPHPIETKSIYGREHRVKAFPYLASDRLLEYEIYDFVYDGHSRSERVGYVIYDCLRHRVLKMADVLSVADSEGVENVLKAVNHRIDFMTRDRRRILRHATTLNAELAVEPRGIKLVFPAGSLADAESGVASVYLPYDSCRNLLTAQFRILLDTDGRFFHYKTLKF